MRYNGAYKEKDLARASGPHKVRRSPDCARNSTHEVGIASNRVDQNATVNTPFPALRPYRPSQSWGVGCKRSR